MAECLVGRGPELICESECCEDDRERCKTSELDWGTILVTGELSMNTVSKQVFGGKKFLMIAVVDISDVSRGVPDVLDTSGEREDEPLFEKNVEFEELDVMLDEFVLEPFILEVASGGRTENV